MPRKRTIEDMHALAKEGGGRCLSTVYVNNQTKLLWQCAAKHEWKATPNKIQRGTWCPTCARNRTKKMKRGTDNYVLF